MVRRYLTDRLWHNRDTIHKDRKPGHAMDGDSIHFQEGLSLSKFLSAYDTELTQQTLSKCPGYSEVTLPEMSAKELLCTA